MKIVLELKQSIFFLLFYIETSFELDLTKELRANFGVGIRGFGIKMMVVNWKVKKPIGLGLGSESLGWDSNL